MTILREATRMVQVGPRGPSGDRQIVDVAAFGAIDDGDPAKAAKNTTAFTLAYAEMVRLGLNQIIAPRRTKGRYCVANSPGTYLLDVDNIPGFAVRGYGGKVTIEHVWTPPAGIADFTFGTLFRLADCIDEPAVCDLGFDVAPRLFTQGVITATNDNFIEFEVDEGYEPAFNSVDYVVGYSADRRRVVGKNNPAADSTKGLALTEQSGGIWRIDFTTAANPLTLDQFFRPTGVAPPAIGMPIAAVFRKRAGDKSGMIVEAYRCERPQLKRLRLYASPFGLMTGCENTDPVFDDITLKGSRAADLYTAATGWNTSSSRGRASLTNIKAEGLGDDLYNHHAWSWVGAPVDPVAGIYLAVTTPAANQVAAYFATDRNIGAKTPTPHVGDTVEIWSPDPADGRFIYSASAINDPGGTDEHEVIITLDDDLPVGFDPDTWWIYNRNQAQTLFAREIEHKRSVGRTLLVMSDDADIDDIHSEGNFGQPISAYWPHRNDNKGRGLAGYAGGLRLGANYTFLNCSGNDNDRFGGGGIYLFIGAGNGIEPSGPLPDAKPVLIGKGLEDGMGFGGLTLVGHDATVDGLVQRNLGTLRPGNTALDNNDVYVSAGTLTRGSLINLSDGPMLATATGAIVDKLMTKARALRGILAEETSNYIDSFATAPVRTRTYLIDDLVRAIIATGEWSKLRGFFLLAAADSDAALRCISNPSIVAVAHGAPTFTADRGFTGDGIGAYIDNLIAWNSIGQDDVFALAWTLNEVAINNDRALGLIDPSGSGGAAAIYINPRDASNHLATRANDAGAPTTASLTSIGSFGFVRSGGANYKQYVNGALAATLAIPSSAAPTSAQNFALLRSSSLYSTRQVAAAMFGRAPADPDSFMGDVYTALHAYLVAVGAA